MRLHTGDPAIYGAIREQMHLLDQENIPYEVVPGVSSALAAAAALKIELTVPEATQTVIFTRQAGRTPVPERESLRNLAVIRASMCIFLSVSMMDKVAVSRAVTKLLKNGRLDREFADADRRRSILNLSEEGRRVHDDIAPLALKFEADLLDGLSDEEINALNSTIERLMARARLVGSPNP